MTRVILVDNYDSFTFNLFHDLGKLGVEVDVVRNDERTAEALIAEEPDAIVLSPGPCTPNEAGICLDVLRKAGPQIPIFGVCLNVVKVNQGQAPHPAACQGFGRPRTHAAHAHHHHMRGTNARGTVHAIQTL